MLKISATIIALILLAIPEYTASSKASDENIPNVHIAYAHFIEDLGSDVSNISKKYRLDAN